MTLTPADLVAQEARLAAATTLHESGQLWGGKDGEVVWIIGMGSDELVLSTDDTDFLEHAPTDLAACHTALREAWAEREESPQCPTCKVGINRRSSGGTHRCFHCGSCEYVECEEPCVCHEDDPGVQHEQYRRVQQQLSHAEQEITRLKEKVETYGQHLAICAVHQRTLAQIERNEWSVCNCGLTTPPSEGQHG